MSYEAQFVDTIISKDTQDAIYAILRKAILYLYNKEKRTNFVMTISDKADVNEHLQAYQLTCKEHH